MIICIKMNLALNNLRWLICHKNQTNQPTNQPTFLGYLMPKLSLLKNSTGTIELTLGCNIVFVEQDDKD